MAYSALCQLQASSSRAQCPPVSWSSLSSSSASRYRVIMASLYEPFASSYCRWLSEGVAWSLPPLAPRLAPRNLLAFAKCSSRRNSIGRMVSGAVVASLVANPVTLCYRRLRDLAYRADAREWPFASTGKVRPSRRI